MLIKSLHQLEAHQNNTYFTAILPRLKKINYSNINQLFFLSVLYTLNPGCSKPLRPRLWVSSVRPWLWCLRRSFTLHPGSELDPALHLAGCIRSHHVLPACADLVHGALQERQGKHRWEVYHPLSSSADATLIEMANELRHATSRARDGIVFLSYSCLLLNLDIS